MTKDIDPVHQVPLTWPCTSFRDLWEQLHLLCIDEELLRAVKPWLLCGVVGFRPHTRATYDKLEKATNHIDVGLNFMKSESLSAIRKELALTLCQVINLDAIQTYVLLIKFETFRSQELVDGQCDSETAFAVCNFYFQERQALLECMLEILRNDLREEPDKHSSKVREIIGSIDKEVEERTWRLLNATIKSLPSHQPPMYHNDMQNTGAMDRCPNETKQLGLEPFWIEQQTLEQLLLIQHIFLLYYKEERRCSPTSLDHLMQYMDMLHVEALASLVSESALKNINSSTHVSTFLFIEMLNIDDLLSQIAFNEGQEVETREWDEKLAKLQVFLEGRPSERCEFLLILSVFQQMRKELIGNGLSAAERSVKADLEGSMQKLVAALKDDVVASGIDSTAFHSVLKNFLSALLFAFEVNPKGIPYALLELFVDAIVTSLNSEPSLVEQFWDQEYILDQPIRNFIKECQQLFPAFPMPYLSILNSLCGVWNDGNARLINDKMLSSLRNLSSLSFVHEPSDLMDSSAEISLRHQTPEKYTNQSGRQVRILKGCVFQITDCPGLFLDDKILGDPLEFYQFYNDQKDPKFLVSWAVQIDGYYFILCRLNKFAQSDVGSTFSHHEEIKICLKFISKLLGDSSHICDSLMSVCMGDNELKLLDVVGLIFLKYTQLLRNMEYKYALESMNILSECFNLVGRVATYRAEIAASWIANITSATSHFEKSESVSNVENMLPTIALIFKKESTLGCYQATTSFLKLVGFLSQRAVCTMDMYLYLHFALYDIISNANIMVFKTRFDQVALLTAAYNIVKGSLRACHDLHNMYESLKKNQNQSYDWLDIGLHFYRETLRLFDSSIAMSVILKSSVILYSASKLEDLHMRGNLDHVDKMESSILEAGAMLLVITDYFEKRLISLDTLTCVLQNFSVRNEHSMTSVITSYCTYQFNTSLRMQAYLLLSKLVHLSHSHDVDLVQGCIPFTLTSLNSMKFKQVLQDSLSPNTMLTHPRLYSAVISFLRSLITTGLSFPAILIDKSSEDNERIAQSGWIKSLNNCVCDESCRVGQPKVFSQLMELVQVLWMSNIHFVSRKLLDEKLWNRIETLASNVQDWSNLSSASNLENANESCKSYHCRGHACAVSILAHELFFQSASSDTTPDNAFMSGLNKWLQAHLVNLLNECSGISISLDVRKKLQHKLKAAISHCASSWNTFPHEGIKHLLKHVNALMRHYGFSGSYSTPLEDDLQNLKEPFEDLFLACLKNDQSDSKMVKLQGGLDDYVAQSKLESLETTILDFDAHSTIEIAAVTLATSLRSILCIMKETGSAPNFTELKLKTFMPSLVKSFDSSLKQLTNHEERTYARSNDMPAEQLLMGFHTELVEVIRYLMKFEKKEGHLGNSKGDTEISTVIVGFEDVNTWLHNWLLVLLNSEFGRTEYGLKMSGKILFLIENAYTAIVAEKKCNLVSVEVVLKTFSLACSFCHTNNNLKLSSLMIIKTVFENWLSFKLAHGEWTTLLQMSSAMDQLCNLGDLTAPSELRILSLMTATSIAANRAGACLLIGKWKGHGTFRQLIAYSEFLFEENRDEGSQEWNFWLELVNTLLHSCSELQVSCDGIDALRVFTLALVDELHLYICNLLKSFASDTSQLDLAKVTTVEYTATLLYSVMKFAARWHLTLPQSMNRIQQAVVEFLYFVAQPGLRPYASFEFKVGKDERKWCDDSADFDLNEGWFAAVRPKIDSRLNKETVAKSLNQTFDATKNENLDQVSEYSFRVAWTIYTTVSFFLDFLLLSFPFVEIMSWNMDTYAEELSISLVGIQIQTIHLTTRLHSNASKNTKGMEMSQLLHNILSVCTLIQAHLRNWYDTIDKQDRNSWSLMSSLNSSYLLLHKLLEESILKFGILDDALVAEAQKIKEHLRVNVEKWSKSLSGEDTLLTTSGLTF